LKIAIKEGSVVVDTCKEPKEKPKIQAEESLENIDYDLWLVVKSMKLHAHSRVELFLIMTLPYSGL